MTHNNIFVNDQKLDEFLKDKTQIKDDIERTALFKEQTQTVRLGRHLKARYKQHRERNGKVKQLGIKEINRHGFEKTLTRYLKAGQILNSFVTIMLCYPTDKPFSTQIIADIIEKTSKKNGIPIDKSTNHSLRGRLGIVRKSELADYMYFIGRNTPKNKSNVMKYGIREDYLDKMSLDQALELARTRKQEFKNVVLNPDRQKRTPKKFSPIPPAAPPVKIPEEPPAETPEKPDLLAKVIDQLNGLKDDDSAVFVIKGDIHIHVNIERG